VPDAGFNAGANGLQTAAVRMRKRPETEAEMAAILDGTHETGACGQQNKPV
jgi:hypothetical protein